MQEGNADKRRSDNAPPEQEGIMMSKEMVFEVRNERGQVRALFRTRWQAEKFAEEHKGCVVVKREA